MIGMGLIRTYYSGVAHCGSVQKLYKKVYRCFPIEPCLIFGICVHCKLLVVAEDRGRLLRKECAIVFKRQLEAGLPFPYRLRETPGRADQGRHAEGCSLGYDHSERFCPRRQNENIRCTIQIDQSPIAFRFALVDKSEYFHERWHRSRRCGADDAESCCDARFVQAARRLNRDGAAFSFPAYSDKQESTALRPHCATFTYPTFHIGPGVLNG